MNFSPIDSIFNVDLSSQRITISLKFFFHEDSRYVCYSPNLKPDVVEEIYSLYKKTLSKEITSRSRYLDAQDDASLEPFSKFLFNKDSKDRRIEKIDDIRPNSSGNFSRTIYSTLYEQMLNAVPKPIYLLDNNYDDIAFTLCTISNGIQDFSIISRFNYPKVLKSAMFSTTGNQLSKVMNKMIGLESRIDLLFYDESLYVFNHQSLDRIFFFNDFLKQETKQFRDDLVNIQNIMIKDKRITTEIFSQDDISYIQQYASGNQERMKKLWQVNSIPGRMKRFLENVKNIPLIPAKFNLELSYVVKTNTVTMKHTPMAVNQLLKCMCDKYYVSILLNEPGEDSSKA
ncbi:Kiwa anti-phage protein KwaB-like domain-containing protein [Leuconostoc mesenteroides subsp. mesenteroides]|uniref:Kiwa anti-phage protein KwaB-like domain-containing protein n=1 Tax=Leuconostoc mesenteroides TaxID=1245 RepID=UPI0010AE9D4A|nr:Kiwa anti-phage protein KwaB-like domain-containing protein [Leuconostoc mesenteroides]TJY27364.1 DUF4868 domain-containing protein [Leuconostoc mesenteroides subsp. mesenteroides]